METYTFLLTIASIVIPVFATILVSIYTVTSRIKAEHKPYIVLQSIETINILNKCYYFLVMLGSKFKNKYKNNDLKTIENENYNINVKIKLRNIGYGVATNVKFYDLNTGTEIDGNQELSDKINQRLYTTFDMASGEEKSVQTSLFINEKIAEDVINTMCIYQDLNGNVYNFVFSIDIKNGCGYNYYAYQKSSHSYKRLMKQYKVQKIKILLDYYK